MQRIASDLNEVFGRIRQEAEAVHAQNPEFYATAAPLLRLVTPLADGADTMAADAAVENGFEINAILPFPRQDYERDFDEAGRERLQAHLARAKAVFELDGRRGDAHEETLSYLATGHMTLKQCDLLVAVWDGENPRGLGGTGMIVEAATQQRIPIIWVNARESRPPCLLSQELGCAEPFDAISDLMARELAPPFGGEADSGNSSQRAATDYLGETEKRVNYSHVFRVFEAVIQLKAPKFDSFRRKSYLEKSRADWSSDTYTDDKITQFLLPRFAWADNLATHYAEIYRSSYIANYLLSAVAVFLALAALVFGGGKTPWLIAEVVVILTILFITLKGKSDRWHEKWIDYRQLAEQLRHLRYLYIVGGEANESRAPHEYEGGARDRSWVQWLYNAAVREMGLADTRCTEEFKRSVSGSYLESELDPQISYHKAKSHSQHRIEHGLHVFGEIVFAATLAACLGYLAIILAAEMKLFDGAYELKDALKYWVVMATAFLPALGAALLGIRVQGEFSTTAERSEAMGRRLAALRQEMGGRLADGEISMLELQRFVEAGAETMLIEIVDWRFVYSSKPLSLPA
ncbi:MAG: hypothetical protein Tsb0010_03030 [Parvularculaceae bacterium]